MREKIEKVLKLEGYIITQSALHIGSQKSLDPMETDNPVIKDNLNRPLIPGSSLKGIFRSTLETTLRGIGLNVCSPVDNNFCVPQHNENDDEKKNNWEDVDFVLENACIVCKLFGAPYLASKIRFDDAKVVEWKKENYVIRDGVAIDRETRTAAHGKKYDFEVVPPDTKFHFGLVVENYEDYEVGMIAFAIDLLNEGFISLGGNTSRGLGKVKIQIEKAKVMDKDSVKAFFSDEQNKGKLYREIDWDTAKQEGLAKLGELFAEFSNKDKED